MSSFAFLYNSFDREKKININIHFYTFCGISISLYQNLFEVPQRSVKINHLPTFLLLV